MKYVASKNQKAFMAGLKCVYKATTLNAAELTLDELETKWGDKYPLVIKSWPVSGLHYHTTSSTLIMYAQPFTRLTL